MPADDQATSLTGTGGGAQNGPNGMMGDEVYYKPSDLLELARGVGAFPWFLNDEEPAQEKEKRMERSSFGRQCEYYRGRTFTIRIGDAESKINFDAIGESHARRYMFKRKP